MYSTVDLDYVLNLKSSKTNTHLQYDINVVLGILQAGRYKQVGANVVNVDGKFNINAVSNHVLKIQKVDGSILYDALELYLNMVEQKFNLKN